MQSNPADILSQSTRTHRHRIDPAVSAILFHCTADKDTGSLLLLHLFSNGGSSQLLPFLEACGEAKFSHSCHTSNFKILAPGVAHSAKLSIRYPTRSLNPNPSHAILLGLLYLLLNAYFVTCFAFGITDPIKRIRQALNSAKSLKGERGKCYVYGDADKMVHWHDLGADAKEAKQKVLAVCTGKFEGSGHVPTVRQGGGARFWTIVNDVWQGVQALAVSIGSGHG